MKGERNSVQQESGLRRQAAAGRGRAVNALPRRGILGLALLLLALTGAGCHGWGKSKKPAEPIADSKEGLRIEARSATQVARLSPADTVRIMQRLGFSNQQIVELGTDLHNALLLSGAAEVYYGKTLEMIVAVVNGQIQIQCRTRGTFVYDLAKGRFVLGSAPSEKGG